MSEGYFRRRNIPADLSATSKSRAPRPKGRKKWRSSSDNAGILKWSKSEESLVVPAVEAADEAVLYQTRTCTDIFSPQKDSGSQSPVYNKDAKVVISVTVEGSAGPIRAMMKLGSNIEDAIKLVIKKYNEEGRTPRLDIDAATTCELHHSYFSLQSLSRSNLMGEVGTRSFYLRKCTIDKSQSEGVSTSSSRPSALSFRFLPGSIAHKMRKIIRRTQLLWELMCCIR